MRKQTEQILCKPRRPWAISAPVDRKVVPPNVHARLDDPLDVIVLALAALRLRSADHQDREIVHRVGERPRDRGAEHRVIAGVGAHAAFVARRGQVQRELVVAAEWRVEGSPVAGRHALRGPFLKCVRGLFRRAEGRRAKRDQRREESHM